MICLRKSLLAQYEYFRTLSFGIIPLLPPPKKIRVGSYRSYEYHSLQYKNEIRAAAKHVRQFLLYSYSIIADSTLVNNSKIITEASSDVNKSSIIERWRNVCARLT